jgi:hypothetical protein
MRVTSVKCGVATGAKPSVASTCPCFNRTVGSTTAVGASCFGQQHVFANFAEELSVATDAFGGAGHRGQRAAGL